MSTSQSPLSIVLFLFCLPLLGALTAGMLGLSFPIGLLPVAVTAGLGTWLGLRIRHGVPADSGGPAPLNPAESRAGTPQAVTIPSSAPCTAASSSGLSVTASSPGAGAQATPIPPAPEADPKLRHDIRNILSPAMLAAEQLGSNTDPLVLKAVRTIDESLDRALLRLKQKPQS